MRKSWFDVTEHELPGQLVIGKKSEKFFFLCERAWTAGAIGYWQNFWKVPFIVTCIVNIMVHWLSRILFFSRVSASREFWNVQFKVTLYSKHTWALTFQNFFFFLQGFNRPQAGFWTIRWQYVFSFLFPPGFQFFLFPLFWLSVVCKNSQKSFIW